MEESRINVIFFGSSQQGETSLVKNILDCAETEYNQDQVEIGDTFDLHCFKVNYNNKWYNIYDICGLNESTKESVDPVTAFKRLEKLLSSLEVGIALAVYMKKIPAFAAPDDIDIFQTLAGKDIRTSVIIDDDDGPILDIQGYQMHPSERIEFTDLWSKINSMWIDYCEANRI
jgi:hypothetical protein